jgi:hypothetical protein
LLRYVEMVNSEEGGCGNGIWFLEPVIMVLLVTGGVEMNPGPPVEHMKMSK